MLQRDGVVMVKMKVLMMMVMKMMISMRSSSMVMTMATISPLWEGISPTDFYLPESFLSLCISALQRWQSLSLIPLWGLRFLGTTIYARGRWQNWARMATPLGGAARGWPAPPGGVGPWLLPSLSPAGYFCLLMKYEFLGIFLELLIFRNMSRKTPGCRSMAASAARCSLATTPSPPPKH
jgi:hypothetical protein